MHEQGCWGFNSQILFFMKFILLQDYCSPGDQEITNEKTCFASCMDLSLAKAGKKQSVRANAWYMYKLFQRGEKNSLFSSRGSC